MADADSGSKKLVDRGGSDGMIKCLLAVNAILLTLILLVMVVSIGLASMHAKDLLMVVPPSGAGLALSLTQGVEIAPIALMLNQMASKMIQGINGFDFSSDPDAGYSMVGWSWYIHAIEAATQPFTSWTPAPHNGGGGAYGGAIEKVFGGDPMQWAAAQFDPKLVRLLGDNCMSIQQNLKNVAWDSILVYNQCFDPEKSSRITTCDGDGYKYYGSQDAWSPIIDTLGKMCQLMIDVAPEP
jgi:hypothetical protein